MTNRRFLIAAGLAAAIAQAGLPSGAFAQQVKRAEFDAILAKNAVSKGVRFHEGMKALRVEFRRGQASFVHAEDRQGAVRRQVPLDG